MSPPASSPLPVVALDVRGPAPSTPSPQARAAVAAIEPVALACGWTHDELWCTDGLQAHRGLVATLRPGDQVVEVTPARIVVRVAGSVGRHGVGGAGRHGAAAGSLQSFYGRVDRRGTWSQATVAELEGRAEAQRAGGAGR